MNISKNLSRLTLVVPTYNRQDFVLRLIKYWSVTEINLIVIDGSAEAICATNFKDIGEKIRYIHRPVGFYERISESLKYIDTEFVALAGDDEFYIPSALSSCINELDVDQNLVACCGRAVGFSFDKFKITGFTQYERLAGYSIDADNHLDRLKKHMRNYVPSLICSICRSDVWKKAWQHVLQKEFSFFSAGELQFEMCVSYAGRSKVISELMWLRSHNENKPIRGIDPSYDESRKFPEWWRNKENNLDVQDFISIMSGYFYDISSPNIKDLEYIVHSGVEQYILYYNEKNNHNGAIERSVFYLKNKTPDLLKNIIKKFLFLFDEGQGGNEVSLLEFCQSLSKSGVRVDIDEIERITEIIFEFHLNRLTE